MKKLLKLQKNKGMSYVELIVVLSIFAVLSTVVVYNYGIFQDKVDMKSLASDIALKIVEAQKASLDGKFPPDPAPAGTWKPSYGVHFDSAPANAKQFVYFVNRDGNTLYPIYGSDELLETFTITKGNIIQSITVNGCSASPTMTVFFKRPDPGAKIVSSASGCNAGSSATITIQSPKGSQATITVYSSGRVQVD
jgi:prepilin-type N-terminal cleavage/methylation domain-containing protein